MFCIVPVHPHNQERGRSSRKKGIRHQHATGLTQSIPGFWSVESDFEDGDGGGGGGDLLGVAGRRGRARVPRRGWRGSE